MIVVDVEASGVDPQKNSLLSIGAVEFERPENTFYAECQVWKGAHIEPAALVVNGFSKEAATDPNKKTDREIIAEFLAWAKECNERTLVGQNPSFDRDFLMQTSHRYHIDWPFAQRTVDLHSIGYFHLHQTGKAIPEKNGHSDLSLDAILIYVGIPVEPKPHNGLTGALLEAEALSRLLNNKSLFDQWQKYPIPWLK